MKKILFTAVALATMMGAAFAADISLSAGGGGLLGYTFTRYTLEGGSLESYQSMDRLNYAGFMFFDATYAELSVLFQGGKNSWAEKVGEPNFEISNGKGTGTETSLGFSLLGKYPLNINENLSWFSMFGVEYQITLKQRRKPEGSSEYDRSKGIHAVDRDKNDNPYPLSAWNSLWIDLGAGLDYNISDSLFLRGELLFGFRLPTPYEMGALETAKKQLGIENPKLAGLTGSPTLKIAIGYRLISKS